MFFQVFVLHSGSHIQKQLETTCKKGAPHEEAPNVLRTII